MKWCQEFGCVQNERPPSLLSVSCPEQPIRCHTRIHRLAFARLVDRQALGAETGDPIIEMVDLGRGDAATLPPLRRLDHEVLVARRLLQLHLVHLAGREAEAVGKQWNGQLRMIARAVIALPVVLHRELPVAALDEVVGSGDLAVPQVMRREVRRHRGFHQRRYPPAPPSARQMKTRPAMERT